MKENKYNDEIFFEKYAQMERSKRGLEAAGEWAALRPMLPDFHGKRVLDLGCGYGWHCEYAAENGALSVTGVDISEKMLAKAHERTKHDNVRYIRAAIEDADFPPESFDVVLSSLALHYVADFGSVVKKVRRFLSAGGTFIFSAEHPVFTAQGPQQWHYNADGSIDYRSLGGLIDYVIGNGVNYIVTLGTTAETPTLTEEEQKNIINLVVSQVRRRIPIVLGVGGNCTRAVVNKLKTGNFEGIDAILSVVPYYNKPSQEGIYQHYKAIAQATDLPIILYNVPGRTGVNMTAETTLRIAREFKNVIAVKEASGNITQMDDIIKNKPANFNVISGDDGITFPLITLGAIGVISVIGNAFPREFSRMVRLALEKDYESARTIHHRFTELFNLLFVDGNPAGAKSMLSMMGFMENKLRLPLVPTRITTYEKIREVLHALSIKC